MKSATPMKTLMMLGTTALTLAAATAQADFGRPDYPHGNPWANGPAYQQARYYNTMKEQLDRFDARQERQLQRILTGMEHGKLTLRESAELLREHLVISALERQYMSDGRLGPREMRELEERLDRASKHIFFEVKDGDRPDSQPGPDWRADNGPFRR